MYCENRHIWNRIMDKTIQKPYRVITCHTRASTVAWLNRRWSLCLDEPNWKNDDSDNVQSMDHCIFSCISHEEIRSAFQKKSPTSSLFKENNTNDYWIIFLGFYQQWISSDWIFLAPTGDKSFFTPMLAFFIYPYVCLQALMCVLNVCSPVLIWMSRQIWTGNINGLLFESQWFSFQNVFKTSSAQ